MFASSQLTPEGRYGLALDQLEGALDVLVGMDPTELDPSVLGGFVLKMLTQSRRMGAAQSVLADRFGNAFPS